MGRNCVEEFRYFADCELGEGTVEEQRKKAYAIADRAERDLNAMVASHYQQIKRMSGVMAETAGRNVRAEREIARLRENLRAAEDSRNRLSKFAADNVLLRDKLNSCLDILVAVHPHASHADYQTALKKLGQILMENKPQ